MCNRVHVIDGHTEAVSMQLKTKATPEEVIDAIRSYPSVAKSLGLPSAPAKDVDYNDAPDRPQPRLDRMVGNGMRLCLRAFGCRPVLKPSPVVLSMQDTL
mmetsp:Transcript_5973/g.25212  ORF Transcript_5973/g.25212 Transcript_5973/m.25212 type:complete len:100 (+) Transcript_5973:1143-1442(+)